MNSQVPSKGIDRLSCIRFHGRKCGGVFATRRMITSCPPTDEHEETDKQDEKTYN